MKPKSKPSSSKKKPKLQKKKTKKKKTTQVVQQTMVEYITVLDSKEMICEDYGDYTGL
ncbi:MAG: hypothetical protein JST67_10715 [Bacteroidetes bacterium]|nr:hypothetical protein [Bacteroidota bacterium]